MLVSDIPVLRDYWYPVTYSDEVSAAPQGARLFGEGVVLWRDVCGRIRAALDVCPHRGARLSQGWCEDGNVVCPYHGWQFDGEGQCVRIPQNHADTPIPRRAALLSVHAEDRYGLVWLCLADQPREPVPTLVELEDPTFTLVHEIMDVWQVCAPRCIDNGLDVSHLSFVHRSTVGLASLPELSDFTIVRDGHRLHFSVSYQAQVTEEMKRNTGLSVDTTTRTTHGELVQPLVFRGVLAYENGLQHVLYKTATPLDDETTLFCQFIARNDHPDEERQKLLTEIDRRIQAEDKALLEGLPAEFPVEVTTELHTRADRMTLDYRRILADLAQERPGPRGVRPDAEWDPFTRRPRSELQL